MTSGAASLARRLGQLLGPDAVVEDADVRAAFERDWTGRFGGPCHLVVRPADTAGVALVVRECAAAGLALVPQGGNTGLVGGGVPAASGPPPVVLSLRRMATVGPLDAASGQLTAGAGATLASVQARAASAGWTFPVDLTARDGATIGGMVATNAGGVHVIRHGAMRHHVLGVEAVLADGSVISRLGGLVKDNTGYDLTGLLVGSEGTLGIVTAARLRLVPAESEVSTVLIPASSTAAALTLLGWARRLVPGLCAAEITFADGHRLVAGQGGPDLPLRPAPPVAVLLEATGVGGLDRLAAAVSEWGGDQALAGAAVATDPSARQGLWAVREAHAEVVNRLGPPHKLDVTLPLDRLAAFEAEVRAVVSARQPGATTIIWGHLGDGNLHVNVVAARADDAEVDDAVLQLVAAHGGSISAEHGIGRAKVPWLGLSRSPSELAAMRAIKQALDPAGLLNPGVLLPRT